MLCLYANTSVTDACALPTSVSIATATDTWLDPTHGIATSNIIGKFVMPLLAGVPSTPCEPMHTVSCPLLNPSPDSWQAKVVAPLLALSVDIDAIMPTIWLEPAGTCIDAVVDCPYKLSKAVNESLAVIAPSLVL
jgi:hypothetical protein